jgi:hypothetical protein
MIKHVVMWKLRGPSAEEKREQAARIEAALLGLRGKIPGMSSLEVGVAIGEQPDQADLVLMSTHEDWAALKTYQQHPDHAVVAKLIGELKVERRAVDFQL